MEQNSVEGTLKTIISEDPYIKCARRDFEVANILFNARDSQGKFDVCNVIFHLQQSVEKINKFIALSLLSPLASLGNSILTNKQENEKIDVAKRVRSTQHNQAELFSELGNLTNIMFGRLGIEKADQMANEVFDILGIDMDSISDTGQFTDLDKKKETN